MLYERMLQAKKNLGLEEKLIENEENLQVKEEVVIGQDYFDDNSSQSCLGEGIPREDPKSPNDLDPDSDVLSEGDINPDETEELVEQEFKEGLICEEDPLCNIEILKENDNTISWEEAVKRILKPLPKEFLKRPTQDQLLESIDTLQNYENPEEDTSGNTQSYVSDFLEKYAEGSDPIQILRKDLMSITSDVQWIKESKQQNEQWALDFADALNELSVSI